MVGFADTTSAGEAGAVVLRAGSRYVTTGSVPEPDSLEVLRIEKLPTEWLHGGEQLETGDTLQVPLTYTKAGAQRGSHPLALHIRTERVPEEAREVWESYQREGKGTYQSLRTVCSQYDLNPGANPSTQEMVDALMEAGVAPPVPSAQNNVEERVSVETTTEPVGYTPVELYEGIEEAGGPAAEEALEMLEGQVSKYLKKREVVDDYLTIQDPDSQFDEVNDVAKEHGVHWRTVHRYADDLLDDEERIVKAN